MALLLLKILKLQNLENAFSDPVFGNFMLLYSISLEVRDAKNFHAPLVLPAYKSLAPLGQILAPAVGASGKDSYPRLDGKGSSLEASDLWKYPRAHYLHTHMPMYFTHV